MCGAIDTILSSQIMKSTNKAEKREYEKQKKKIQERTQEYLEQANKNAIKQSASANAHTATSGIDINSGTASQMRTAIQKKKLEDIQDIKKEESNTLDTLWNKESTRRKQYSQNQNKRIAQGMSSLLTSFSSHLR